MTLSEFIRQYRSAHHLSQRQLAKLCQLSNGYISILEKGINPSTQKPIIPTLPKLNQLAKGMSMTLEELLEQADDMPIELNLTASSDASCSADQTAPFRKLPFLDRICCEQPIFSQTENDLELPYNVTADFAMICTDDSMINARIYCGDIIYIRRQSSVNHGEIASVVVDGKAALKRVFLYEDHTVLASDNPMYRPITYWDEQRQHLTILGKAVAFFSLVR